MKFLQNLSTLTQSAVAARNDQRQQLSGEEFLAGMQILLQAQQDHFRDLGRLKLASDHFLAAIRSQHRNPDPYIGMAYLLHLVDDDASALNYLHEALRVDPGNQSAYSLQMAIQEAAATPDQDQPAAGLHIGDADLAYDQLEDLIHREIQLMSAFPPPQATTDPQRYTEIEDQYEQLRQLSGLIDEQLATLEQDLDLVALHARLQPIANRLKLYERVLQASRQMVDLRRSMTDEVETTRCLSQFLVYQPPGIARAQLESTLDACDEIADAVNALEAKGTDIHELEADYAQLNAAVLHLQDAIDEMKM